MLRLGMVLLLLGTVGAFGQSIEAQRGHRFAQETCSQCHAVERFGTSPLAVAPPFRGLHELYPVESLEEALAEGIVTAHPSMPQFMLEPIEIADLIAYLKTLE